jgi:hypothetical protein
MAITVCAKALENLETACRVRTEETRKAYVQYGQINNCIDSNICPQCGESLSVHGKSKWFFWLQPARLKCSGCKTVFVGLPWHSIFDPRWAVEDPKG